jgi:uncharacterized protein (TIGR03437 family)
MAKLVFQCWMVLVFSSSITIAQTVTIRTGNGTVGSRDSAVTFLQGPADADFTSPFTQIDFSDAQNGPAAFIVSPNPLWVSTLSADPNAKWIGTNSTSSSAQGYTALYAVSFSVPNAFTSASLTFNYAVDDELACTGCANDGVGTGLNKAIFLNGTPVCGGTLTIANDTAAFSQQHTLTCNDVSSLLQVGTNWLYIDAVNFEGPSGLMFSATINTTDVNTPASFPYGQAYTIYTVAGNGTGGFSGDGGPATSAELHQPQGVAVDSAGNVYIADQINNRIRKLSNGVITTVAGNGVITGNGTGGFSGDGGPATSAQLNQPYRVAVDSFGNLYIADTNNYRIRKVSNGVITTVAGNGTLGYSGDGGPATSAELGLLEGGIAVDSAGNLYIGETHNLSGLGGDRVRKVSNGVITTVAGNGTYGFSGDGGPATSGELNLPGGLAVDSAGNLYIDDTNNYRIRKVSNGVITTVAGNGTYGFSGDGGPATSAQLNEAFGIAFDSDGNLYIADQINNRIREVSNGVITTVAGNGTLGYSGDGGPATSAELYRPQGVAVDAAGNVYIADTLNQRTRVLTPLAISSVENAASYSAELPLAPGTIAAVMGNFPLPSSATAPSGLPWPTSLGGLSVQFGGTPAPLYYAGPSQVNLQVPWELTGSTEAAVTVTVGNQTSRAQTINLAPFSPGLFSMNAQGSGQGAILNLQYQLVDSSNPASVGDVIQVYCTGLGAVTNQPASGALAPFAPLAETATPVVTIGGSSAEVLYSGLAPGAVGLYQLDAQIPAGIVTGPAVPVVVSSGGVTSNTVTVAIQPFPNPQPAITGLSPSSATVGTGPLTLTISGSGFIASSTVTFNGVLHSPSLLNSGQLTTTLTASDLKTTGSFAVVVNNPSPGGGSSNSINFTVTSPPTNNPQPVITSLSPSSTPAAPSAPLTLTINGNGFISLSTVTFNGVAHVTSFLNGSSLSIVLSVSDLALAGNFPVIVINPPPGGGSSTPASFTVSAASSNPVPVITGLTPASGGAGSGPLTLDINGRGFTGSSTVTFNGVSHVVSAFTSTLLVITLTQSDLSIAGPFPIIVTNPAPGGGKATATFNVVQDISIAGKWQGTWNSTLGLSGSASAAINQTGSSLTGTVSLTNSRCFTSGTISTGSTISGANIVLHIAFSGGLQMVVTDGQTNGRGQIIGNYTVQGGPCADGLAGSITLDQN